MILRCELPEKTLQTAQKVVGDVLYCVPYDIDDTGNFTEGFFIIGEKFIAAIEGDAIKCVYPIDKIEKVKGEELVGGGRFWADLEGVTHVVAAYSSEFLPQFAMMERIVTELCEGDEKALGHENFDESQKCPICGRRYIRNTRVCPHCSDKKGMFKRIVKIAAPCKKLYMWILTLFWMNSAIMLISPAINKHLVNDAINGENASIKLLLFFVGLTALATAASSAVGVARSFASVRASNFLVRDLRNEVYSKLQGMGIGKLEGKKTGDMMQRINGDTRRIGNFVQNIAVTAVNEIILFVGVGVVLFCYNWKMAILILIPVPIVVMIISKARASMHRRFHTMWRREDKMTSALNDILNGMRVVKAFGKEKWAVDEFTLAAEDVKITSQKNDKFFAVLFPMIRFLIGFGSYFILLYGGSLVVGAKLSLGELMQFSTYASYLYNRMEWFSNLPEQISRAVTSCQRVFEILDESEDSDSVANGLTPEIQGNIRFENVSFGYKSYRSVVKNFNLDVKKGEMIGLVGHSGAGKSTVINLLMRLYDVDEGRICIDGVNVNDIDSAYYKHELGIVLQESYLFAGTIFSNITYAHPEATIDDVIKAAKIANAHDFILRLPNGYDTYVGEKGYRLSGGERQRISIARAVISDPKILILDEATASVDTETEAQIQEALTRLIKGRTTIAIAHRLSTLKNANRLVVLEEGCIAEMGTHGELMEKDGIYASLVKAQRTMNALNFNADEGGGKGGKGRGGRKGGPPPR